MSNEPNTQRPENTPAKDNAEASTSGISNDTKNTPQHSFAGGDDFISFSVSDTEGSSKRDPKATPSTRQESADKGKSTRRRKQQSSSPPPSAHVREWDRGKRKFDAMADDYDNGYSKKQRADAMSRKAPWANNVDWNACNNVAEMLHLEVEAFTKWISPTPVEDEVRGLIIAQITRAVTEQFPDARVHAFGSYETKLYLPLGDIDLVILSESMAYSNKVNVLHALANTMRRAGITDTKVTVLAKTKVPLVKFVTTYGRFSVDISINQANGVAAVNIVNGFLRDMHGGGMALRSLVMLTKSFLSQRSMNEVFTGGLGSYSIVCLAVSFLQMHPKIRRGEINAEKNLGVLAMEFFELYGCYFNYEETGISLRDGGTYYSKAQRGWLDPQKAGLLSIEDPSDPNNDVSSGSYGIYKVRASLAGARNILNSTAYLRAATIEARRNDRHFSFRTQPHPEEMSILASVMGITQETINHRRLTQEVYDTGALHRIVGVKPLPIVVVDDSEKRSSSRRQEPEIDMVLDSDEEEQAAENSRPARNGHTKSSSSSRESKKKSAGRTKSQSHSRSQSKSKSTLENAELILDSDDDEGKKDSSSPHHPTKPTDDNADEDGGRYDIGRKPPPHKRQKTGTSRDEHIMFTTDDDEDDDRDSLAEEEEHYSRGDGEKGDRVEERRRSVDPMTETRRSYWLSKAIAVGGGGLDHDG